MSALLSTLAAQVRLRLTLLVLLRGLPWVALAGAVAWRVGGSAAAWTVAAAGGAALLLRIRQHRRRIDHAWMIRRLDGRDRALHDSSDLLYADAVTLSPLQAMQRTRLEARLRQQPPRLHDDVRWWKAWLRAAIAVALSAAVPFVPLPQADIAPRESAITPTATIAQSLQGHVTVTPPAYTGLEAQQADALDVRAPQDSLLAWQLQFAVAPAAARLRFVDGHTLELTSDGASWRGERQLAASTLYRIEIDGAAALPDTDAHRIDITPDHAPQLDVQAPERTLTVLDAATPRWELRAEAYDDHGLGDATLELTLAQRSGEQVTVSERRIALRGEGDAQRRRYTQRVDLAALGFAQGDDLIARFVVRDRRTPQANVARSPAYILRWPPSAGADGSGVEGLVQQAMPAYFRSQRQIIIDTEALIAERASLDADTWLARADTLGVDQRILRLRYGQFLGEEAESKATPPPAPAHVDEPAEHTDDDGHDHAEPPAGTATAGDLMAAAGHLHDLPEAATLLDPETRKLLRGAIDAMWQSERELRSGAPAAALPHEYRALDFIKRVQQADRIYLARVGLELPQLDATRRLTGTRPTRPGRDPLVPARTDHAPDAAWVALQQESPVSLDALQAWLDAAKVDNPLDLLAAIDVVRADAACGACRERLAALLWPHLTPPSATPTPRAAFDATERAWLDAVAPEGGTR